jgi:hypothetical protein
MKSVAQGQHGSTVLVRAAPRLYSLLAADSRYPSTISLVPCPSHVSDFDTE